MLIGTKEPLEKGGIVLVDAHKVKFISYTGKAQVVSIGILNKKKSLRMKVKFKLCAQF